MPSASFTAPDRSDAAGTSLPPVLTASGICHSYGDRRVLEDLSLTVRVGERVAIVGENGAGKTTLMRICARLLAPAAGTLQIDGRVGYCPQIPGLHDLLTPDEHLALFSPAMGLTRGEGIARGRELLAEFGFPAVDHGAQIRHLSGGCQQKLNLTLALLGGARRAAARRALPGLRPRLLHELLGPRLALEPSGDRGDRRHPHAGRPRPRRPGRVADEVQQEVAA